ncbi:MAG TPA: SIP domain-containing protein [Kofleriaceae bacterium]|jgi:NADPH-dependent ferric siderophore reductase
MSSLKRSLLEGTLGRFAGRWLTVSAVKEIAPKFWRLDFTGMQGASYSPGDKLQLILDDGPRTYSPFGVKGDAMSLISYAHGSSPGAQLGPTARVGTRVNGFGPRSSVALKELGADPILVGDETSLGVARALHELRGEKARYIFEVSDPAAVENVIAHLELANAVVMQRRASDAHHAELGALVLDTLREKMNSSLALTGKAATIQMLRAKVKNEPGNPEQRTKAYWAPGKRGLD